MSNVPAAGDGPFRELVTAELAPVAIAPFVLAAPVPEYREPSVVAATDDPASTEVWMYAVATVGGAQVIVRTHAVDARSFYGDEGDNASPSHTLHTPPTVLQADQPWEGAAVAGPSAARSGGQILLYYAAAGGIGLATSNDGLTFTKAAGPVLPVDASFAWETTAPHAPSVAVFPDGTWHMLYGAGGSIGEATSPDGQTWTRVAANPVLAASAVVDPASLSSGAPPPFDEGAVDHPMIAPQTALDGRLQVRVLYTGYGPDVDGGAPSSAIGLAGRYGAAGALSRQATPVYTVSRHEAAPAFFEMAAGSLLYVQQDDPTESPSAPFTAIAAGFSPASGMLGAPLLYPSTP